MIRVLQSVGCISSGGMEAYIMNIYRNIDRTKVQFDFLVATPTDYYKAEIESLGGKVYYYENSIKGFFQYYRFLRKHPEYKIIHSHRDFMSAIYLRIAKIAGVKFRIAHSHNSGRVGIYKIVSYLLRPFVASAATHLYACGQEAGKWLFGKQEFVIAPNCIDVKRFAYNSDIRRIMREKLGFSETDFVVGHIGHYVTQKNHTFLIQVMSELLKKHSHVKLMCVGSGALKNNIIEQAVNLGISDNCKFCNTRNDIPEVLQAFDIIVFPSLFEGFSFAMLEMQASSLPIVCSDVIPSEINLTGDVCFLSLNESPAIWADKVWEIKESYKRISKNGAKIVSEKGYDIKETAKKMENFYLNLC